MKYLKFVSTKLTIWSGFILGLMILFSSNPLQISFAPPPESMMTVDPTLRPENVTASIG